MVFVQDDCSVLKNRVAHCHLRKLVLQARNCSIRPILDGVKDNCSITQLHVHGKPMPLTIPHKKDICNIIFTQLPWQQTGYLMAGYIQDIPQEELIRMGIN